LGSAYKKILLYQKKRTKRFIQAFIKPSQKNFDYWAGSTLTNHYQILDANTPEGKFKEFSPRERGLEYSIEHYSEKFYVVTNLDAQNFRLMETPVTKTEKANWKEKIAHRKDTLLQGIEILKTTWCLSERLRRIP
jgi:oligopeptidase B